MQLNRETLIGHLPEFENKWILLHTDQTVFDIIHEVLKSHKEFSKDYDKIVHYFDGGSIDEICRRIYNFCKKNFKYIEESEDQQTVSSPGAMLSRGHVDCKGYSNFAGGILSALNRQGANIDWCYRFASYNLLNDLPHHVFIVVNDNGDEIWIDPTPGSNGKQPYWITDKKIKDMPIYKISGISDNILPVSMHWNKNTMRWEYEFTENPNTIGDILSDLQDYGSQAATDSADAVIPGSGSILTSITTFFKSLFGRPSDPAQAKVWFMFQIPRVNPTKAEVQKALDIAKQKYAVEHTQFDSNWMEAFTTIIKSYQALIDLMNIRDQLIQTKGLNPASYGIVTGIGYTSSTGIQIKDSDVFTRAADPVTGPADLQNIVTAINQQIAKINPSGTAYNTGGTGTGTGLFSGSGNNTLLLVGAGVLAYLAFKPKKRVTGKEDNTILLIGAGLAAVYFMTKKSTSITTGPIDTTSPANTQTILPGDIAPDQIQDVINTGTAITDKIVPDGTYLNNDPYSMQVKEEIYYLPDDISSGGFDTGNYSIKNTVEV